MASASASTSTLCSICSQVLVIPSPDSETQTLVDDVCLPCPSAHHFHWECITSHFEHILKTAGVQGLGGAWKCPAAGCEANVGQGQGNDKLLVSVRNEGGFTPNYDLSADVLDAIRSPAERRTELFLSLISQRDWREAETFLIESTEEPGQEEEDGDMKDVEEEENGEAEDEDEGDEEDDEGPLQPVDVNSVTSDGGLTALHLAAFNDDVEAVEMLLRHGARTNIRGAKDGATALEIALQRGAMNAAKLLRG
ncbi:hypothetical protein T439DRAFT_349155 [Meredithblackwellia eburnea MCA 4105]